MATSFTTISPFIGKRVLVTGGANGVGKAIVQKFYEARAKVFVVDKDEMGLEKLREQFPEVESRVVDLLDWDGSKSVVEELLPFDHLVNNAGIAEIARFLDVSANNFDRVFGVNVRAAFNITQVFAAGVIKHKLESGTIVNISSMGDTQPLPGASTYSCSKAALTMLTKCSANELGKHNIRVNCIRPTGMDTAMQGNVAQNHPEIFKEYVSLAQRQVLNQLLQTTNVADLVLFLSSPQSSTITGQGIAIDCGFTVC